MTDSQERSEEPSQRSTTVLVTGASGYIGGRLVPRLLQAGYEVRVLVRSPQKLIDVPWAAHVPVIEGDLTDEASVSGACVGVEVLYHLVHAMGSAGDFEETEAHGAQTVAGAAQRAGVKRII